MRRYHEERAARNERVPAADDELERVQLQQLLTEELLALNEPYRSAVVLRYRSGARYRAIGERLGISEQSARKRVSRGLALLRTRLERRCARDDHNWLGALVVAFSWTEQSFRIGWWTEVFVMGSKGIAATVAAAGAIGLVAWSVLGDRPEFDDPPPAGVPVSTPSGADASGVASSPTVTNRPAPAPIESREALEVLAPRSNAGEPLRADLRIENSAEQPIEGACVRRGNAAATATDEHGRARPLLGEDADAFASAGTPVEFTIGHEGYVETRQLVASDEPIHITLLARPSVRGRVVDASGIAITARGRVSVGVLAEESGAVEESRAALNEDGSFHITGLPVGRLRWVRAMATGFSKAGQDVDRWLAPDTVESLDVMLREGVDIAGSVVDAVSGRPLAGAFVWTNDFFWGEDDLHPSTTTDADGRFLLEGVDVAENKTDDGFDAALLVFAQTDRHAPDSEPTVASRNDDEPYAIVIELERTLRKVTGVLREPGGGAAAAAVRILLVDDALLCRYETTDEEGRFTFDGLPGGPIALFAWRGDLSGDAGCATAAANLEGDRTEELDLELSSSANSVIQGVATGNSGRPMPGVTVELGLMFRLDGLTVGSFTSRTIETDREGRFAFENVPPGRYTLRPMIDAALRSVPESVELALQLDERSRDSSFVIGTAITFAGSVASADGASNLRAVLVETGSGEELEATRVDAEGRFVFRPVLPGAYSIVVMSGNETLETVPVGPNGADDLQIFVR